MTVRDYSTIKDILRFEGTDKAAFWGRFAMLLTLAVIIATMGLLRNSGAVVIAAMLVAPLMTPILGIASSIVMGWVGRASMLLLIVWFAAGVSVLIAWLIVWLSDVPRGIIIPNEVLSRTDPGAEDLVIALAAGVAGAYVQIQKSEISLLPGAAIGVSLVPPLAAAGILLYFEQWSPAYEAVLLFATNFGAIILSACMVYVAFGSTGFLFRNGKRRVKFTLGIAATAAFLIAVFAHLFSATYNRHVESSMEAALAQRIKEWARPISIEVVRVDVDAQQACRGLGLDRSACGCAVQGRVGGRPSARRIEANSVQAGGEGSTWSRLHGRGAIPNPHCLARKLGNRGDRASTACGPRRRSISRWHCRTRERAANREGGGSIRAAQGRAP
jgi:uncharacterized hydrophobic protein (TIGR00271 family)